MRRWGLLTLLSFGCAANPAPPPPEPAPRSVTSSEPRRSTLPPLPELATFTAPPVYHVRVTTTHGEFIIGVDRNVGPNAADRLFALVQLDYYRDVAFSPPVMGSTAIESTTTSSVTRTGSPRSLASSTGWTSLR